MLSRLQEIFAVEAWPGLPQALARLRAFDLGEIGSTSGEVMVGSLWPRTFTDPDVLLLLEIYRQYYDIAEKPPWIALGLMTWPRFLGSERAGDGHPRWARRIGRVLDFAIRRTAKADLTRRQLRIALCCMEKRLQTGAWPGNLDDLVGGRDPKWLKSPLTGLRMSIERYDFGLSVDDDLGESCVEVGEPRDR